MTKENKMMNHQNAINEIHALVANSEVNDAVAEKLLAIAYWLETEFEEQTKDVMQGDYGGPG
tara:strand:+ start:318 stop:503 length:186 start_codon:yes stop_codon:yes gene_type:complete